MNEKENQKKEEVKDDIVKDFDSVVREGSVLSSVSGIIFGFLLNISINSPTGFTAEDSINTYDFSLFYNFCCIIFCNACSLSSSSISL